MGGLFSPPTPPRQRLVTQAQYDEALANFEKGWKGKYHFGEHDAALQEFKDSMVVPPPPAPDVSDELVTQARAAARRRLVQGASLVGPLDMTPVAGATPGLKGY